MWTWLTGSILVITTLVWPCSQVHSAKAKHFWADVWTWQPGSILVITTLLWPCSHGIRKADVGSSLEKKYPFCGNWMPCQDFDALQNNFSFFQPRSKMRFPFKNGLWTIVRCNYRNAMRKLHVIKFRVNFSITIHCNVNMPNEKALMYMKTCLVMHVTCFILNERVCKASVNIAGGLIKTITGPSLNKGSQSQQMPFWSSFGRAFPSKQINILWLLFNYLNYIQTISTTQNHHLIIFPPHGFD